MEALDEFVAFSAAMTGFTTFALRGTGLAELYLSTASDIAGEPVVRELLDTYTGVADEAGSDEAALERGIRIRVMSDAKLGPVARNLVKLWYAGTWHELPADWREAYGANNDRTFIPSPDSYTEGLLWPAVGANPSGAKPFGYGTWAAPPRVS